MLKSRRVNKRARRKRPPGGIVLTLAVSALVLVPAPARAERMVTITGGGYGHGIGMSQYGAYGRALKGWSSTRILQHYYSGARVTEAVIPRRLRVGLLPEYGSSKSSVSFTSVAGAEPEGGLALRLEGDASALSSGRNGVEWRVSATDTGRLNIYKNGVLFKKDGVTGFGGPERALILDYAPRGSLARVFDKGRNYPYGRMEITPYPSSSCARYCLRLVLVIPMQEYLYGLGEVPSSWPAATLKAQAISGRTYALHKALRSQNRFPCGCAVYDSTIDQAYIGDDKRVGSGQYWDEWKGAVDATDRRVLTVGGEPVQPLYSASSGGYTENNENVWGGTPVSYLRGVPDGADRAGGANPYFRWTVTMSWSSFSSRLAAAYGTGTLEDFQLVKPFGVSGRVTVVTGPSSGGARVSGSGGTARVSGWSLRSALGLRDTLFRVDLGHAIGARFEPLWEALDGAPGDPVGDPYAVPRDAREAEGRAQDFEVGRMTYNRARDKVVWQHGPILRRYNRVGREASPLGMPRTGIWGRTEPLGATYERGRILWSGATGAHSIAGGFDEAFLRVGGLKGRLGLPKGERREAATLPGGGRKQTFENGTIYKNPSSGRVFALWGAIAAKYRSIGEATSACGYPKSDVIADGEGQSATFQHGTITYTSSGVLRVRCG